MNPRGVAATAPRVPYEANASWAREVLHTGVASTLAGQLQLPMQPRAFAASVPLLRHGVLDDSYVHRTSRSPLTAAESMRLRTHGVRDGRYRPARAETRQKHSKERQAMPSTVILGTARTPFGKMGGTLSSLDVKKAKACP